MHSLPDNTCQPSSTSTGLVAGAYVASNYSDSGGGRYIGPLGQRIVLAWLTWSILNLIWTIATL